MDKLVDDRIRSELASALVERNSAMLRVESLRKIFNCLAPMIDPKHNDWETPYRHGNVTAVTVVRWMLDSWCKTVGSDATVARLSDALRDFQNGLGSIVCQFVATRGANQTQPIAQVQVHQEELPRITGRPLRILSLIDGGGYGKVYKADIPGEGPKCYAVKFISIGRFVQCTRIKDGEDYYEKLLREVRTLSSTTDCPHVVSYLGSWFEGTLRHEFSLLLQNPGDPKAPKLLGNCGKPPQQTEAEILTYFCIQMELCDMDLLKYVDTFGWPELEFVEEVVKNVLLGLQHIHTLGIAHRDIQPKNILLTTVGNSYIAKIGDMGLAREVVNSDQTLTNQIGFPEFRSPEMWRGDKKYCCKTDIFSLGLIYMLLVCRPRGHEEYARAIEKARKDDLSTLSDAEDAGVRFDIMRKMLARNAMHRPGAKEALDWLEEEIRNRGKNRVGN